jgi:glucose/arabinose dehydrogenase
MKKILIVIIAILVVGAASYGAWYYYKNLRGAGPAVRPPSGDIGNVLPPANQPLPDGVNNTEYPLKVPQGFAISIYAKNLPGARVMAIDAFNNMWVSQTSQGKISQIENSTGKVNEIFKNLNRPHGLAIDPENGLTLYIAEETKISRVPLYSDGPMEKIIDLPKGGRHYTRTLEFGPDGRLYVSIGSTCDVCNEKDEKVAAIYSMNKDGSDFKKIASGLRNSVFFDWSYVDGKMWATEMGRDNLGDNLPPDEVNIIASEDISTDSGRAAFAERMGKGVPDFGWPVCFGNNVHDANFDKNIYIQNPCNNKQASYIDLPAHSAPLGLAFVPEEGWPEEYWYDLLVAFHGSWNRTQPTGYKIARIKLDAKGNVEKDDKGQPVIEDFLTGWLAKDGKTALGRPVDLLIQPGGTLFVSDDKAGVIYKLSFLSNLVKSDASAFRNMSVKDNQTVKSPIKISGEAKGTWFFEASFPIEVVNDKWEKIGQGIAQAESDWMTTGFVKFNSTVNFDPKGAKQGWLVFKKDNPSGLPENDAQFHLPVKFE